MAVGGVGGLLVGITLLGVMLYQYLNPDVVQDNNEDETSIEQQSFGV